MKKGNTTEVLSELHAGLADLFMEKLREGEMTTADLNVARQFLKDNQISSQPVEETTFGELAKALPEIENVIAFKKKRA
tara:strand:- start:2440 stop:2676 length:237 start_codon:yes stop_codon:yes gene_type:complete